MPGSSFPAEALAVGLSAEDGNDVHAVGKQLRQEILDKHIAAERILSDKNE